MFRRLLTIAVGGTLGVAILAIVTIRVGAIFGAGASLDAYLVGVSGPSLLLSLMSAVIISTVTPRLSVRGPHDAARRTGEWALLAFLVGAVLAGVIAVCRTGLITLLAPGLMTHSSKLAARVLAIYAVSLPATLAASVYSAYGFASNRVWTSGASAGLYGVTWLGLLFTHTFTASVTAVAIACVIASQVQLASAFLFSAKRELHSWPRWRWPSRPWLALAAVSGIALNVTLGKANILLDPMLGSLVGQGDVSLLVYATRITVLMVAICGQGPALAVLGGRRSTGDPGNPLGSLGFGATVLIACGMATAVAILFEPAAQALLGHGQFTSAAAMHVGRIVEAYAPAIVFMTVAWSLEAVLYSLGFSWRLVALNLPVLLLNVGLSVALVPSLGVMARPIAVGASTMLYVGLLAVLLRRLPGGFDAVASVPRRTAVGLMFVVALVALALRLGGNRLVHAPAAWAITGLMVSAVGVLLATRVSIRQHGRALGGAQQRHVYGAGRLSIVTGRPGRGPRERLRAGVARSWRPLLLACACGAFGAAVAFLRDPPLLLLSTVLLSTVLLIYIYKGATGLLVLLFGCVALVPVVTGPNGEGNQTLSALRTLMIAAFTILAGVQLSRRGGVPARVRAIAGGLAGMAALGAVVTMFTSHGASDYVKQASQAAGQPLAYLGVFLVLIWLFRREETARETLVAAWCLAVVMEGAVVAVQLLNGSAYDPLRGFTRAQGTMGSDFLGVFAAMGVFAGAYLRASTASRPLRRLGTAAVAAGIFTVIGSVSRGALIGLALALVGLLLGRVEGNGRRRILPALMVILVVGVGLFFGRGLWEARLNASATASFDRPATWISGLRIATDHPLTGVGPRNVATIVADEQRYSVTEYGTTASNPHSAWLFVADSEGIPYGLLLVWVTIAFLRALATSPRSPSRRYLVASLTAGGAIFLINNLFNHPEIVLYVLLAGAVLMTEPKRAPPIRTGVTLAAADLPAANLGARHLPPEATEPTAVFSREMSRGGR